MELSIDFVLLLFLVELLLLQPASTAAGPEEVRHPPDWSNCTVELPPDRQWWGVTQANDVTDATLAAFATPDEVKGFYIWVWKNCFSVAVAPTVGTITELRELSTIIATNKTSSSAAGGDNNDTTCQPCTCPNDVQSSTTTAVTTTKPPCMRVPESFIIKYNFTRGITLEEVDPLVLDAVDLNLLNFGLDRCNHGFPNRTHSGATLPPPKGGEKEKGTGKCEVEFTDEMRQKYGVVPWIKKVVDVPVNLITNKTEKAEFLAFRKEVCGNITDSAVDSSGDEFLAFIKKITNMFCKMPAVMTRKMPMIPNSLIQMINTSSKDGEEQECDLASLGVEIEDPNAKAIVKRQMQSGAGLSVIFMIAMIVIMVLSSGAAFWQKNSIMGTSGHRRTTSQKNRAKGEDRLASIEEEVFTLSPHLEGRSAER